MPISAIDQCEFLPRRLSAKPAQVWRTNPSKSVKTDTRSLNQKPIQRDRARGQKNWQFQNENCWIERLLQNRQGGRNFQIF